MTQKKYFLDFEFHEFKRPVKFLGITIRKVWTIDMISIGICCDDGREYYAINRDLNLKYAKKDKWLKENVISKLPLKRPLYPPHGSPRLYQESMRWLPMKQIMEEIIDFVGGRPEIDDFGNRFFAYKWGKPIFMGYYGSYDWVVFCWIFGRMIDLPNGFPMYIRDIKQMLDEKIEAATLSLRDIAREQGRPVHSFDNKDRMATFDEKVDFIKRLPDYPKQSKAEEHNALSDARFNQRLYEFIKQCEYFEK